jgi:hypothetical protein
MNSLIDSSEKAASTSWRKSSNDIGRTRYLQRTEPAFTISLGQEGSKYLAPIVDAYFQLRIADDHFLYIRGLAFFGQHAYAFAFLDYQERLRPRYQKGGA